MAYAFNCGSCACVHSYILTRQNVLALMLQLWFLWSNCNRYKILFSILHQYFKYRKTIYLNL